MYSKGMKKTTIVLNEELLDKAKGALGTRGVKDTVDSALHQAVALQARRSFVRAMTAGETDLLDPEVTKRAWGA
jgi:Arc/MetJ family transcription regulator